MGNADALAYGIVLQAVEIATAVVMGAPALVREGLSWRDVRLRALHATPVTLPHSRRVDRRLAGNARSEYGLRNATTSWTTCRRRRSGSSASA